MSEENTKNTYEEKKIKREQVRAAQRKKVSEKRVGRSFVRWLIVAVIVAGLIGGFALLVKRELPQGEDFSQSVPIQGRAHIQVGSQHDPYNSNPPTSGPHYSSANPPAPAPVGFYEFALLDEQVVHNLEHGDVWVSYHPRVSDSVKDELRGFARDRKVLITSREANEFDISLSAWGRVDGFNVGSDGMLDAERVQDFISRYKNKGPEQVVQPSIDGGGTVGGHNGAFR